MDYDHWANLGNPGWSYEEVLSFFKKAEDMRDPVTAKDTYHHSVGGPLSVERLGFHTRSGEVFVEACNYFGLKYNTDFNGADQFGCGFQHQTTKKGSRASTAKMYLNPVKNRPNLTILLYARVERVLLDGNTAKGVRFIRHGKHQDVFATREVILSSGAIVTPQILMLSGIGPKFHLEEMGIPVKNGK